MDFGVPLISRVPAPGGPAAVRQRGAKSKLHQLLLCEGVMRQPQGCKHQVCVHCGGRFGMVTYRWWGSKFCKRTCKDAYLREVTLDRDTIRRWFDQQVSHVAEAVAVPLSP